MYTRVLHTKALILQKRGELELAEQASRGVLTRLLMANGTPGQKAIALDSYGGILLQLDRPDEAQRYLDRAAKIRDEPNFEQ